jgi:trk system potassium uptake protein TrkH
MAMAGKPSLQVGVAGFHVELQADAPVAEGEGLVGIGAIPRQLRCAIGQIESLTMPVKGEGLSRGTEGSKAGGSTCTGYFQLSPSDLTRGAGIHIGAQRRCHELGSQADAQGLPPDFQPLPDQFHFRRQPRIAVAVVYAHGTSEDHNEIRSDDIQTGDFFGGEQGNVDIFAGISEIGQYLIEASQIFESDVAQRQGGFHASSVAARQGGLKGGQGFRKPGITDIHACPRNGDVLRLIHGGGTMGASTRQQHQLTDRLRLIGLLLATALTALIQTSLSDAPLLLWLRALLGLIVLTEIGVSLLSSPFKFSWLRQNIPELLLAAVFVIYASLIISGSPLFGRWGQRLPASAFIILRNFFLYFRIGSRVRRLSNLLQDISLHPAQTLVISFMMIILVGAILLMTPVATADGRGLGIIDALFTSTSAVCVTGLIVVDTATHLSLFGKIVVLLLIQAGGLGIMLLSYTASWVVTRHLKLSDKLTLAYMTNEDDLSQVSGAMLRIVLLTLGIELAGALLLFLSFLGEGLGAGQALWFGLFHSVSAFCNAGFALFSDSFEGFRASLPINAVLSALIILGGISFAVIINLGAMAGLRPAGRQATDPGSGGKARARLSLNSKVVLSTTGILLLVSTLLIYFSEHGNSLAGDSLGVQYMAAFFQAVTLRTAGFNTVNFATFSSAAIWVSILFMVIGGASGSTAGGIKVNTIAVIYAYLRSRFRGQNRVLLFNFALSRNTASNALVLFVFAVFAVSGGFFLLLLTERGDFTDILFETVSAFGTVGLSRGITGDLSAPGRMIVVLLMFVGRIGPLTLLTALADRELRSDVIYPEQEILIG